MNGSAVEAGGLNGSAVEAGGLNGSAVEAGGLNGSAVEAGGLNGSAVEAGGLNGSAVEAGGLNGSTVEAGGLNGSAVEAGGLNGSAVEAGGLNGSTVDSLNEVREGKDVEANVVVTTASLVVVDWAPKLPAGVAVVLPGLVFDKLKTGLGAFEPPTLSGTYREIQREGKRYMKTEVSGLTVWLAGGRCWV